MTGADRQNGPGGKERLTVMAGEVAAVCISEKKGTAKQNIGSCNFIEDWGLEKDAHAGNWHRQVSLLSWEEVENSAHEARTWRMELLVKSAGERI